MNPVADCEHCIDFGPGDCDICIAIYGPEKLEREYSATMLGLREIEGEETAG